MRELIYLPVIHEVPECHYLELNEQEREDVDAFERDVLPGFWIMINRLVRDIHAKTPIHKVYGEGFFPDVNLEDVIAEGVQQGRCMAQPAHYLISHGAAAMPTEHRALAYLSHKVEEIRLQLNPIPMPDELAERFDINQGLELARLYLADNDYRVVGDLCRGETKFDVNRLRDKHIAQRINETLLDDEYGMLFLGAGHKAHEVLAYEVGEGIIVRREGNGFTEDILKMIRE